MGMPTRQADKCARCLQVLPLEMFSKNAHFKAGLDSYCRPCRAIKNAEARARLKAAVLAHYGGRCACCKTTEPTFLAVDHIHGGGTKHQAEVGDLYRWLKKSGYPSGFQVLCHNCNFAKYRLGSCPPGAHHP